MSLRRGRLRGRPTRQQHHRESSEDHPNPKPRHYETSLYETSHTLTATSLHISAIPNPAIDITAKTSSY
ncbi:MAG TPA: hypothetical protein VNX17_12130 [Edaphobacter sp.]|nr:hypothetical protein [Edaphobacter sp.]